jgi:hypothetical protein
MLLSFVSGEFWIKVGKERTLIVAPDDFEVYPHDQLMEIFEDVLEGFIDVILKVCMVACRLPNISY